ncbi:uncharacterized protein PHALS_05455 [Plasmopara halstedii]|uniref:Uncharacterized protein n=1 Tax=Plasmopara halstedii TaxID=4781 RepID=A0A0P1B377_PLAHL|nr:uncharacterized protein PHALS_05455 [Plasmopara halstedii]CEG47972.1 hypothetical protein PHALS_05455 [Plasmopara halstedii]|eukprot:XP_024584341.1 hypothetical protein PHALS_05455 [Plasmopara halstedii]
MGSKHSRHSQSSDDNTQLYTNNQQPDDEVSPEARAEFTVDDIYSPENTRQAQRLHRTDHDRFCKFRNYFKNHHMSLAKEVGRQTKKNKALLLHWIESAVGPLEDGERLTKDEILEIAMVSAALTEYGESVLSKVYDQGKLDALPNLPLHTHHLRMTAKQQACRDGSDAINKDKLEAAHYIGLEVMLRLNERLPVEQRMGEELRNILNHPTNLRLVLATSNQTLHKKVDTLLINATNLLLEPNSKTPRKLSAREYDRLVQIAKHAQDHVFQDAMIAANGHHLYLSLRNQFLRLETDDRPKLWDVEKDKREFRYTLSSRHRSPSPVPNSSRTSRSPEKKPEPTSKVMQNNRHSSASPEMQHQSTFSRFAAKIFRSRTKKKHIIIRTTSKSTFNAEDTTQSEISEKRRVGKTKNEKKLIVTAHTKPKKGKAENSRQHRQRNKGKRQPHTVPKKQAAKSTKPATKSISSSNQDIVSDSGDSDYVDIDSDQETNDECIIHVGPRGGKYYINASGKKVYVK